MYESVLLLVLTYLVGGVPIGLMLGKLFRGVDVRDFGSGNIGASNVWRTLGPRLGISVFILDVLKGLGPVYAAHGPLHERSVMVVLTGIAAILGHNFSPFLGFKGGKGVATSLGVLIGLAPLAALISFGAWGLCLAITRYISVSSIAAALTSAITIWITSHHSTPYTVFGILALCFVTFTHRGNLKRLRVGTEPKVCRKPRQPVPSQDSGAHV